MTSTAHSRNKQFKDAMTGMRQPTDSTGRAAAPAWHRILTPLASLKLTVVLFALGIFLIFAGTFALKEFGLWTAMKLYFRCWITWIDIAIFFPADSGVAHVKFPYPGGWTIGFAMLFNLIAAHTLRFKVKAGGARLLGASLMMLAGLAFLSWGLYMVVVSQPQITQSWWEAQGRPEGVGAALLGSALVLWTGVVIFERRAGIFLTHAGIIILLLSELVTGLAAVESKMRVIQGETAHFTSNTERPELAFIYVDRTGAQQVVAIPTGMLAEGAVIDDERLPFKVKIEKYFVNTRYVEYRPPPEATAAVAKALEQLMAMTNGNIDEASNVLSMEERGVAMALLEGRPLSAEQVKMVKAYFDDAVIDFDSEQWKAQGASWIRWHAMGDYEGRRWIYNLAASPPNLATIGDMGDSGVLRPIPESPGTSAGEVDMPGAYVTLTRRDGEKLGTVLLTAGEDLRDDEYLQKVNDGKRDYRVTLRFERYYKPYTIHVKEVRADRFTGSDIPRNYSTQLERFDEDHPRGEEAIIRMNEPMRFSGETFYQSGIDSVIVREGGTSARLPVTILQVVNNPGYLMPYIACIVVSVGLMLHFGINLYGYVRRSL